MSKTTTSRAFRNVDVDKYDEDTYQEDAEQNEEGQDSGPNEAEIHQLLMGKKNTDALKLLLKNPPVGSKDAKGKDKAFQLVMRVMSAYKSSEVEAAVKALNSNEVDVLMKYIYRGFAEPSDNSSAILLAWHEKTLATGGLGSIVRVLTDRKTV